MPEAHDLAARARRHLGSLRGHLLTLLSVAGHTATVGAGLVVAAASAFVEWQVFREILGMGSLYALVLIGALEMGKVGAVLYGRVGSRVRALTAGGLFALSVVATFMMVAAGTDAPGAERLRAEERARLVAQHDEQARRLDAQYGPRVAHYEARVAEEEVTGYGRLYRENLRQRDALRAEWARARAALDAQHAEALRVLQTQATFRESPLAQQRHVAALQTALGGLGLPLPYGVLVTLVALLIACVMEGVIYTTFEGLRERFEEALAHQDRLDAVADAVEEKKRAQEGAHEAFRHDVEGRMRAVREGLTGDGAADGSPHVGPQG